MISEKALKELRAIRGAEEREFTCEACGEVATTLRLVGRPPKTCARCGTDKRIWVAEARERVLRAVVVELANELDALSDQSPERRARVRRFGEPGRGAL